MPAISSADTAWLLTSTALVLVMTPALGFFYGGMVRAKNALNTLMMSFSALGFVGMAWAFFGYSVAFGHGSTWCGGSEYFFLRGVGLGAQGTIPHLLFFAYQGTFAIITAALISGAIVERMRFGPYIAFITLWSLLVYAPVAHWVWGPDGMFSTANVDDKGNFAGWKVVLDFAGGTVVHVNAAAAALACAVVVGARKDYARTAILPQNVPFTLLGAGLLWLGWFGFNAGSALGANKTAALAFANTMLAPTATLVVWTLLDLVRTKKATAIGAATGIVVGLVAVTPAAGFIGPMGAVILGAVAAFPSYFALLYRARTRLDDSLDVVAAHGVGGTVGALLTGILCAKAWNADGADASLHQLGIQFIAVAATLVYSLVATFVLVKVLGFVTALRASPNEEGLGLDFTQHGEEAYARGEGAILLLDGRSE
ncbi:MAG TPA: ammonium transporter [Thermoanaerobaculia bacterium]|nr:ammonium transporter [Thermoanaerobaculia bacterium]